jgi:hypothetical protein
MKKFIMKTLWFVVPILLLHLFTFVYYSTAESPDLLRLGYIIDLYPNYCKTAFPKTLEQKINYTLVSEKPIRRKFKVMTIGDSFSEQFGYGYKNYLSKNEASKVLHLDRFLANNQIETLYQLAQGDFFEQYEVEYVILQNIERNFITNIEGINLKKKLTFDEINHLIAKKPQNEKAPASYKFPSNTVLKFPYYTLQNYSKETYLFEGTVYKTALSRNFFSVNNQELLFYYNDVVSAKKNNIKDNVRKLNRILNDLNDLLKKKNVTLIVLPAPDKYDLYYDYIVDKSKLPKPLFFEHLKKMSKNYIYVDSKSVLSAALAHNRQKDIYFYNDTHWSPWASQLIASSIEKTILAQ